MEPYDPTDEFNDDEPRIEEIPLDESSLVTANIQVKIEYESGSVEKTPEAVVLSNAYSVEDVRRLSRKLIDEFPEEEPLVDQSALWVRAVSAFHFFEDRNHRTALLSLEEILDQNGFEMDPHPLGDSIVRETKDTLRESKNARDMNTLGRQGEDMYEKDEIYHVWRRFFDGILP
jgi:hypothetical protein